MGCTVADPSQGGGGARLSVLGRMNSVMMSTMLTKGQNGFCRLRKAHLQQLPHLATTLGPRPSVRKRKIEKGKLFLRCCPSVNLRQ